MAFGKKKRDRIVMNISQILIISPESWDAHFVSKHHYAITLAYSEAKVYFLNPPDNSLTTLQISPTKYKNLYTITDKRVARGLRFYPKFIREYIQREWLERLEKSIGERFDIIWLFENSRFYDMEFASDRVKIYHQVDLNQNFYSKEASSSADICFGTTDYIIKEIKKYNLNTHKIHHGVNLSPKRVSLPKEQRDNFSKTNINATYIGNLSMLYLDVELLKELVLSSPNVVFQFVGGYNEETLLYKACKDIKNIIWWGKIDSEYILEILSLSDIMLVSYQKEHYIDQASPHKIMEYLSCGKVIVSTYTDEYKDKRELLEMVDNSKNYSNKFKEVVDNLDFYNSKDKQKQRIDFANAHTYPKQIEKIKALIDRNRVLFISVDGVQNYLESLFLPLLYRLDTYIEVLEFCPNTSSEYQKYKNQKYRDKIKIEFGRYFNTPPVIGSFVFILYGAFKLYGSIKKNKIDILMPRSLVAGAMVLLVKPFLKNIKIIFESDGLMADERVDFGSWSRDGVLFNIFIYIEKKLIYNSTYVTTRTNRAKDILISRSKCQDKDKFVVIPNGKDISQNIDISKEQKNSLKEKIGIKKDDIVFIYVGSIGSQYEPYKMIEIFENIYQNNYKFIILTPNIDEMKNIVSQYPYLEKSIFIDRVQPDEVYQYLSISDIAISLRTPSFSQRGVSPIKIIEYMMMGLPIISNSGVGDLDVLYKKYDNIGYIIEDLDSIDYEELRVYIKRLSILNRDILSYQIQYIARDEFHIGSVVERYNSMFDKLKRIQ